MYFKTLSEKDFEAERAKYESYEVDNKNLVWKVNCNYGDFYWKGCFEAVFKKALELTPKVYKIDKIESITPVEDVDISSIRYDKIKQKLDLTEEDEEHLIKYVSDTLIHVPKFIPDNLDLSEHIPNLDKFFQENNVTINHKLITHPGFMFEALHKFINVHHAFPFEFKDSQRRTFTLMYYSPTKTIDVNVVVS